MHKHISGIWSWLSWLFIHMQLTFQSATKQSIEKLQPQPDNTLSQSVCESFRGALWKTSCIRALLKCQQHASRWVSRRAGGEFGVSLGLTNSIGNVKNLSDFVEQSNVVKAFGARFVSLLNWMECKYLALFLIFPFFAFVFWSLITERSQRNFSLLTAEVVVRARQMLKMLHFAVSKQRWRAR